MSLNRTSHGEFHSYSAERSQSMKTDNHRNNPCHLVSELKSPVLLPNVPLIHLSRLRSSNWSFIENHKSSDYFYSRSYLNDALNVSSRIPITPHRYRPCSTNISYNNRPKKDDQQINFKRIKQIIFGSHLKLDQKSPCTKQQPHIDNKLREKEKSPHPKKLPVTSQRRYLLKKCQRTFNTPVTNPNSLHFSTPLLSLPTKNTNNLPLNVISHTRFGKSMLALYFQKYRFISPFDNTNKKEQFLKLNQSRK